MKNKNILITIVIAVIAIGAGFVIGMQYQKSQAPSFTVGQFRTQVGRGGNIQFSRSANGNGMMPVAGEVLSSDDKTVTIKLNDGSSKIVILSDKTTITKNSEGTKEDLKTGEKITAFGTKNSDGSITAMNISLGNSGMRAMPFTGASVKVDK